MLCHASYAALLNTAVLCCAVLCCAVLCCAVLSCALLCWIVPCWSVPADKWLLVAATGRFRHASREKWDKHKGKLNLSNDKLLGRQKDRSGKTASQVVMQWAGWTRGGGGVLIKPFTSGNGHLARCELTWHVCSHGCWWSKRQLQRATAQRSGSALAQRKAASSMVSPADTNM